MTDAVGPGEAEGPADLALGVFSDHPPWLV
ncbi:MAG: hypothetical protein JWM05_3559, partial [Acidimicrobiales bacterium]|nr:hypothetical protein [Acidimicrobiales bacterium]